MHIRVFQFLILAALLPLLSPAAQKPNIVVILADDLGYGDLACYGANEVKTPSIDRLAREGLRFTDAHSAAATCTPSRYSLLTGEYAFRKRGTGVLPGDAALIIEPGRTTLPSMLKRAGYRTGAIGKWHLGLGAGDVNWNGEIKPGPLEIGFDYAFIMAATGDRVPCVYVENRRVVGLDPKDPIGVSYQQPFTNEPTGSQNPELLKVHPSHGHDMAIVNGISRIGYMTGGKAALWDDETMADTFASKAVQFIEQSAGRPFFLYFASHDIHVPRIPHPRFKGKTDMGVRGDVIVQLDWCVGQILDVLDRKNLAKETLILFTSDNGPVLDDGYLDEAVTRVGSHRMAGPLRGSKYSAYEAGSRVPFVLRWPAEVKAGTSDALMSQVDFLATFAGLAAEKPDLSRASDSENHLDALLGKSNAGRQVLVRQGGPISIRSGQWKMIPPNKGQKLNKATNTEPGNDPNPQLYDLASDLGEKKNRAPEFPDKTAELSTRLNELRSK